MHKQSVVTRNFIISCIVAGVLLLISNSALWANRQIFDNNAFNQTAVTSLTSQSSRDAIAAKITDEALQSHPKIQNVVDDSLIKLISGLLDSDRFETVLSKSVSKLYIYTTSSNQEDVAIDLTGVKNVMNKLVEVSARTDANGTLGQKLNTADQKLNGVPDQIVLINADDIPDFYNFGVAMTLLAPFTLLAAVILFAYPYIRNTKGYLSFMVAQGVTLIFVGLAALLVGPIFRPITLGPIQDPNIRIVAGNLYDSFLSTFSNQTAYLITIGFVVCALALIIKVVKVYRKNNKPEAA